MDVVRPPPYSHAPYPPAFSHNTYIERGHRAGAERGGDGARELAQWRRLGDAGDDADLNRAGRLGALQVIESDDGRALVAGGLGGLDVGLGPRVDGRLAQREVRAERHGQVDIRPGGGVLGREGERVSHGLAGLENGLGALARDLDGLGAAVLGVGWLDEKGGR